MRLLYPSDGHVVDACQVLYNLFEWARMRHARIVIVGVANTMDLPERLTPKVRNSRTLLCAKR